MYGGNVTGGGKNDNYAYDLSYASYYWSGSAQRYGKIYIHTNYDNVYALWGFTNSSTPPTSQDTTNTYYFYGNGNVSKSQPSGTGTSFSGTWYVHFRRIYTIIYNSNGGTGGPSNGTTYAGLDTKLSSVIPSKTGYTFGGWSNWPNVYSAGDTIPGSEVSSNGGEFYLSAQWTPNTYSVDINIMSPNGVQDYVSGTMDVYYSYIDTTYSGQSNEPITTATIPYTSYMKISNIIPAVGMTVSSVSCTHNSGNLSQSGGTYTYTLGGVPNVSNGYFDEIYIYMRWADYTVSFNSNGGSYVSSKSVTYNSMYGTLSSPTKTGYTFAGWYKESSLSTQVSSSTTVDTIGNHTLYAKWNVNYYYVDVYQTTGIYDITQPASAWNIPNGKRNSVAYGSSFTISCSMFSGYVWDKWVDENGNTISTSQTYTFTMGTSNRSFYARAALKEFYININILNPNGAEDGVSGTMDLRYSDGVVVYNVNNENQDNGHSKGIKYQQTIVISNIRPMNNYALKSVTCNYGTIVDNGNGSWTYTATQGDHGNFYGAVISIQMTYLHYDEKEQYYYFEDGEYPQTYVGDSMNATLSTYFAGTPNSTYDLTYNDGETDLTVPVYTYTDGKKYARVSSLKDNDKEWVGTGSNFYYLSKNYAYRDKITVNVWACMENWNTSSQHAIISWTNDGGWNIYVNPGSAQGTISSDIMVEGEGYTYRNISYGALSSLSSGWHMFTLTFDGRYIKTYTDGAVVESIDLGSVKKIKAEIFGNDIVVGAECGYNEEGTPNGANFVGKVKNVQIRNMCLSEDNVKELYDTGTFGAWFKVEPIRWRVSDYGVSKNESNTNFYSSSFNLTMVSDKVLSVSATTKNNRNYEGWSYTEGELYKNLMNASGKIDLRYATTDNSVNYSKYGEKGQIQKVDNINPNLIIASNIGNSGGMIVNSNIFSADSKNFGSTSNVFSCFKVQIWTTSGGFNQVLEVTETGRYDIVFTKNSNTSYLRIGFNGNLADATINYTISGLANGEYTFSVNLISYSSTGGSFGEIKLETGTKYTGAYPNVSGIRTVSKSELEASFTDFRAKGSDLVCFLLGTKFNEYVDYWTRDLQNLGTGYVCTKSGNFTSKWLNSVCGVRFAITLNGSYRK